MSATSLCDLALLPQCLPGFIGSLFNRRLLAVEDAQVLIASARLQHALTQVLRIALDQTPEIDEATPGLKALLAEHGYGKPGSLKQSDDRFLAGMSKAVFSAGFSWEVIEKKVWPSGVWVDSGA